jgi:hypothetical protein
MSGSCSISLPSGPLARRYSPREVAKMLEEELHSRVHRPIFEHHHDYWPFAGGQLHWQYLQRHAFGGGYRRDHPRALAQRVEVDAKEVRIMDSKSVLLRTLVAASSAKTADFGVPGFVPKWRATADEDGHYCFAVAL